MKKLLLLLMLVTASVTSSFAQSSWKEVKGNCVVFAAFNGLEFAPVTGVSVGARVGFLYGEIESGWTYFADKKLTGKNHLYYISPSIGFCAGDRTQVYMTVGATPWGTMYYPEGTTYLTAETATYSHSRWYPKFKFGSNFFVYKNMYLNTELQYVAPLNVKNGEPLNGLVLRAGIGFSF